MTDAQTEAREIASVIVASHGPGGSMDNELITLIVGALAAKDAELAAVRENCETVCNSYADENQRLFDRAERAEAQLAEAMKALEPFARVATAYLIGELDDEYRPDWSPFIPCGTYREARRVYAGGEDE